MKGYCFFCLILVIICGLLIFQEPYFDPIASLGWLGLALVIFVGQCAFAHRTMEITMHLFSIALLWSFIFFLTLTKGGGVLSSVFFTFQISPIIFILIEVIALTTLSLDSNLFFKKPEK